MSACEKTHGPHSRDPRETLRSPRQRYRLTIRSACPCEAKPARGSGSREVATYHEFAAALIEIGLFDADELERFTGDSAEGVLGLLVPW